MHQIINFQLDTESIRRLERTARAMNRPPDEAASVLIEEGLRLREFPGIEFRDTAIGRQAYLRGTRLAIWQIALIARDYDHKIDAVAQHLGIPSALVSLAMAYTQAHTTEIDAAIDDIRAAEDRLGTQLSPDTSLAI